MTPNDHWDREEPAPRRWYWTVALAVFLVVIAAIGALLAFIVFILLVHGW